MQVHAENADKTISADASYDFFEDVIDPQERLDTMVETWGIDVCVNAIEDSVLIALRAFMKRLAKKGDNSEKIQTEVSNWNPGLRIARPKQTKVQKAANLLDEIAKTDSAALDRLIEQYIAKMDSR